MKRFGSGTGEARPMTVRIRQALVFFVLALVSTSSYAQKVNYDWDKDVDFTPFRTYKWVDLDSGKAAVETTHKRIISNIDGQLQAKSFKKLAADPVDVYVTYQIVREHQGQIVSFNPDGQWQPGPGMTGEVSKPTAGNKLKGALVVDVYDPKSKKLIWRGIVAGEFESRQAANYQIDKGLAKLFMNFPPRPQK